MALEFSLRQSLESFGKVEDEYVDWPYCDGFEDQVRQLTDHFVRATKKSTVLVGEPGVGKTTILRQFFRHMVSDEGWALLETSAAEIIRGATYVGEWQTRLTDLANYASVANRVLLYVSDIHSLSGAGRSSSSQENMAEALVPFLDRGDVVVFGECTPLSFRQGIERTPSFQRQLTTFQVAPAGKDETWIFIESAFLGMEADFLAATQSRLELPETTGISIQQLGGVFFSGSAQPGASIDLLRKVVEAKQREVEQTPLKDREKTYILEQSDIVHTLHKISGLPLHLLDDNIPLDLKETRDFFDSKVVGQNEAITTVTDVITLVKAGLTDTKKPISIILFAGPTGVGKTELAKALAEFLFGSPDRMIRCDMSEYKDYHSYEKFIGRDRSNDSNNLVSRVRQQPFSVILLDEIEKANPNIFDVLLQAFDDGRLTDAQGNTGNLTQTIIIMTSNLGSDLSAPPPVGFDSQRPDAGEQVGKALRAFFRPEFLNRIDHIVRFNPLERDDIRTLAKRELGKALLRNGLTRRALRVTVDPEVHDLLAERGYDAKFGARPLRRQVEKLAVLPVAREIIALNDEDKGSLLRLSVKEGSISVQILADRQTRSAQKISRGVSVTDPVDGATAKIRPEDLKETLAGLETSINRLEQTCVEDELDDRKSALVKRSTDADFWDDQAQAREILSDIYRIERLTEAVASTRRHHDGLARKLEHILHNPAEGAFRQLALDLRSLEHFVELVRFTLECRDRGDRRDAFVAIRLVDEAAETDLVYQLADTYQQWAWRKQYGFRVIHEEEAAKNCLREVVLEITGPAAYGIFRGEEGEHEFIYGRSGRQPRKNHFVSVRVLRTPANVELKKVRVRKKAAKQTSRFGDNVRTRATATDEERNRSVEILCCLQGKDADEAATNLLAADIEHAADDETKGDLPNLVRRYQMKPSPSIKDQRVPDMEISPREFWKGEIDEVLHQGIKARTSRS